MTDVRASAGAIPAPAPATVNALALPFKTGVNLRTFPQLGIVGSATTSNTLGNNTLRLSPCFIPNQIAVSHIGADITAAGDVGSVLRLGIYADNGSGYPGALIGETTVPADIVAVPEGALGATASLPPGIYWVGGAVQGAPIVQPTIRVVGTSIPGVATTGAFGANAGAAGYSPAGSFTGALPATAPASFSVAGTIARVSFRLAS